VIAEKFSGTESTDLNFMAALNEIGILYSHQEKMGEAEAMYQRAQAGKDKALASCPGSKHPFDYQPFSIDVLSQCDYASSHEWAILSGSVSCRVLQIQMMNAHPHLSHVY
jgi:hypothetical protein